MTEQEQPKECPECGNSKLLIYEQITVGRTKSARTGKVLKNNGFLDVTCWNFMCKCGWHGEIQAE